MNRFLLIEDDDKTLSLCEYEGDNIIKADVSFDIPALTLYVDRAQREIKDVLDSLNYKSYLFLSKGYLRSEMPQISSDDLGAFVSKVSDGDKVAQVSVRLRDLKPTQIEFNDGKIYSMSKQSLADRTLVISKDNYILDGHHWWASGLENDDEQYVTCYMIDLPIDTIIERAHGTDISHKKDVNGNILKSYYLGYEDLFKAESGTWSERLRDKHRPARWITYRGNKVLIKIHGDGTASVVYSKNPAFEHLKIIPKSSSEYESVKKNIKKVRKDVRQDSEITEEKLAADKAKAKDKKEAKIQVREGYYQSLAKVVGMEEDTFTKKEAGKVQRKVDKVIGTGDDAITKEEWDNLDGIKKRNVASTINKIAEKQILDDLVGEHADEEQQVHIATGNKDIDKKLRKLKITTDQAIAIQELNDQFKEKNKAIDKEYGRKNYRKRGNVEITTLQGIGVYDINDKVVDIKDEVLGKVIKKYEDQQRALANSQFYSLVDDRSEKSSQTMDKTIGYGAIDSLNAVTGEYLKNSSIDRRLLEFIGVRNAASLITQQVAKNNPKDIEKIKADIETILVNKGESVVKDIIGEVEEKWKTIDSYADLRDRGGIAPRTASINIARQYSEINKMLGVAAGSLESGAQIVDAFRDIEQATGDIVVDGGANIYSLRKKMKEMGIGDIKTYVKEGDDGRYRVTIPTEEFDNLLKNGKKNSERNERVMAIKNLSAEDYKKQFPTGYRPKGVSSEFVDFKSPKQYNSMSSEQKKEYQPYINKKGEDGYTSEFKQGSTLYGKRIDGFGLKPLQYRLAEYAKEQKRVVWDAGAGSGKTIAFLSTVADLKNEGKINYAFQTVPSRLVDEFFKDQQKFFPNTKMIKLDGDEKKREKILKAASEGKYDIVIQGHDSLASGSSKLATETYITKKLDEHKKLAESEGRLVGSDEIKRKRAEFAEEAKYNTGTVGLVAKYQPDFVGVDEAHETFKDVDAGGTLRQQAIKGISKNSEYAVYATGTPIRNTVGELASLIHHTRPDIIPSAKSFKNKHEYINQGTSLMQGQAIEQFRREMDDVVISEKTDVKAKKIVNSEKINLSDAQVASYGQNEEQYRLDRKAEGFGVLDNKTGKLVRGQDENLVAIKHKLWEKGVKMTDSQNRMTLAAKKILSDNGYDPKKYTLRTLGKQGASARRDELHRRTLNNGDWKTNGKFQKMKENIFDGSNRNHLMFFQRDFERDTMMQMLKDNGAKESEIRVLDKYSTEKQKRQAITDFQKDPNVKYFLSSSRGATGITLDKADAVHHLSRFETAAKEDQANARAWRGKRVADVNIHHYDSQTPFDVNRVGFINRKRRTSQAMGAVGEDTISQTAERLRNKEIKKSQLMLRVNG